MRPTYFSVLATLLVGVFVLIQDSSAQVVVTVSQPTLTVSTGYSNVEMQKTGNLFYDHSGPYVDADIAWTLRLPVPLQVGIGATGSGYWDRENIDLTSSSNNFYYPYDHLYSDLGFFELEPRVGIRLGGRTGFFIMPRAGAGLLVNSYGIDRSFTDSSGNTYIDTDYHTGAAFEVRPAIQAGYDFGFLSAGVEGSYMWSWGDFGGFGHHAQEYRVGAFLKFDF
jgi:hypothetical protein